MPLDADVPLVDALASVLRHRILSGELAAGSRLPSEAALSAEFEVSRTVVREAVSRLRAAGVVDTQQGRGSFVLEVPAPERAAAFQIRSRSDLVHLMELRIAVESETAGLAAQRLTPSRRAEITAALDAFTRAGENPARVVEADFAFHLALAEASQNPYLVELLHSIGPRAIMLHRTQLGDADAVTDADHLAVLVHEHRSIHDAVLRGDPEAARAAMQVHLRRSLAALREGGL